MAKPTDHRSLPYDPYALLIVQLQYASSQKSQITESPKTSMLHLKQTTLTKTIASLSL